MERGCDRTEPEIAVSDSRTFWPPTRARGVNDRRFPAQFDHRRALCRRGKVRRPLEFFDGYDPHWKPGASGRCESGMFLVDDDDGDSGIPELEANLCARL